MRFILGLLSLLATQLSAQAPADAEAIHSIIQNEADTWNKGNAAGYSRDFSATGTFTNIRGEYFTGHAAYLKQHEVIFQGIFKGTTAQLDIESLQFVTPDVAVVEALTAVSGITEPRPGMILDAKGRLRTRLLQVVAKQNGQWKIVAYHNVDVKPGVPLPDPGSTVGESFPGAVPELPVSDVARAAVYYEKCLGFTWDWGTEGLGQVSRGDCQLFLTDGTFRERAGAAEPVVIWINLNSRAEVDALHQAWSTSGARIVAAPESKPWNLHEFTAADLDGNLLRVFYDFAWELPDRGGRGDDAAEREAARPKT